MKICHDELKDALVSFRIFLKSIILIENVLMFDFLFENLYIYIYYQKPLFIIKMGFYDLRKVECTLLSFKDKLGIITNRYDLIQFTCNCL